MKKIIEKVKKILKRDKGTKENEIKKDKVTLGRANPCWFILYEPKIPKALRK